MSEKLLPCPFCGEHATKIATCMQLEECAHFEECPAAEPYVCMVCSIDKGGCGASTGYYDSAEKANAAWNRRAQESELPANNALTRDELYYLDGEPLYVMDGEGHECYCVVNTKNKDCIDNEAGAWCFEFYDMTGDGKHGLHKMGWRAYRTKPERSEGE